MLEWIREGNILPLFSSWWPDDVPAHPNLTPQQGASYCLTEFPVGILKSYRSSDQSTFSTFGLEVGHGAYQLIPGRYEYRRPGDNRVDGRDCAVITNHTGNFEGNIIEMPYGEPFDIEFYAYHSPVIFDDGFYQCSGAFYRIGD